LLLVHVSLDVVQAVRSVTLYFQVTSFTVVAIGIIFSLLISHRCLIPRLSPRTTTMKVKEGESLVPFHTWCMAHLNITVIQRISGCLSEWQVPSAESTYLN